MGYKIEWIGSNTFSTFEGTLLFSDLMEGNNIIYGDLRFDNMKFQVIDFTMVQNVDLDENQAKILGTLDKTSSIWNKNIKVALVTDNEKILELIKIYRDSLKETNWVVKTFSDAKDAEEWCNAEKRR